jgi:hypothetical protein
MKRTRRSGNGDCASIISAGASSFIAPLKRNMTASSDWSIHNEALSLRLGAARVEAIVRAAGRTA